MLIIIFGPMTIFLYTGPCLSTDLPLVIEVDKKVTPMIDEMNNITVLGGAGFRPSFIELDAIL
jgi:hypothetical protein